MRKVSSIACFLFVKSLLWKATIYRKHKKPFENVAFLKCDERETKEKSKNKVWYLQTNI